MWGGGEGIERALQRQHLLTLVLYNNNNNNIYLLQLSCHPVAVVILHVNKT